MLEVSLENLLLFHKLYDQTMDPVAQGCGLTRMELDLLLFLCNNPAHNTAAEAVRLRQWTKSHVSAAVHALRQKGLLAAGHPPDNRKVLHLTPLPAAQGILARGTAAQEAFRRALFQGFTPEEARLLEGMLQKIARNLRDNGEA